MIVIRRAGLLACAFAVALGCVAAIGVHLYREGYRAYIVHTGSMTGTYNEGALVIDKPVTAPIKVGEVITFLHSGLSSDVVTHRVINLDGGTIQTKGDANPTPDTWHIRHNQVKGVVTASIPDGGYVAYFFKQRAGDAAAMTTVIALVLLWGLFFAPARRSRHRTRHGRQRRQLPAQLT